MNIDISNIFTSNNVHYRGGNLVDKSRNGQNYKQTPIMQMFLVIV